MPKNISGECRSLLLGLLNKNPEERISWEDFFNNSHATQEGYPFILNLI